MKDRLLEEGKLIEVADRELEFAQDTLFRTASDAASIILQVATPASSAWLHTLPDGREETYGDWCLRVKPDTVPPLNESRVAAAAAWLKTQAQNLETNERAYKLSGAKDIHLRLSVALQGSATGKLNVQPGNKLNMLGWRTVSGVNALVNRDAQMFREALDALRHDAVDPLHANDFWAILDPVAADLPEADRKPFAGTGTRASIASYFLFLADPVGHPFYRPSFGGQAVMWLYSDRPLDRRSPGHLLQDYVSRCEVLLKEFQAQGVPLQDMLDLQGALYILSHQYPEGPGASAVAPVDPLRAEYEAFRSDPVQAFRCEVRLTRAAQIREQLRDPETITLAAFSRDVWRFEANANVGGVNIKGEVYSDNLTPERAAELGTLLQEGQIELHGNYCWGSGAAVYGASLKLTDDEKLALVRQAVSVLNDESLLPHEKADQIEALPGFGPNITTGLTMLFHPDAFALNNRPARDALAALGFDVSTAEVFQTSARTLRERVGAETFPELDWFLYTRLPRSGYWWVNQGNTYTEELKGGYVWASQEGEKTYQHHENVARLRPGDRIVHYAGQAIQATSVVIAPPIEVQDEVISDAIPEKRFGYLAEVEYTVLPQPMSLKTLDMKWRIPHHGPFDKNGNVRQVYLSPASREIYNQIVHPHQAWLFQMDPADSDIAARLEAAQVGESLEWPVTRFVQELQPGDPVVLWTPGPDGGVVALTEVAGPVEGQLNLLAGGQDMPENDDQGGLTVPLRITRLLPVPIARDVIAKHPVLSQLHVMQMAEGTTFKLTRLEWEAVQSLLEVTLWLTEIRRVLAASPEPLHPQTITAQVLSGGLLEPHLNPEHKVGGLLTAHPEEFEALEHGKYRLRLGDALHHEPVPFALIRERVQSSGLRIDDRTLRRYHLALQTRGFVILSGVSGTGKTWLAEAYARAAHAEVGVFPVAPNWTSNEDLLGFYSPLDGGHYHHTPFSRFLLEAGQSYRAAKASGHTPKPYHLILDEMNLARVEYYFAQFLSKMELRARGQETEITLSPDLSALLGPNVFVIGTVNVDETTHDFADKIYDRAQLIELPVTREALGTHLWEHAQSALLLGIWDVIHPVAPFAFRVMDEIIDYQRAAADLEVDALEALDDAVLQKVLPKLRGTDLRMLSALEAFVKLAEGPLPLSHAKAVRMRDLGAQHGIVSFH
ncbi:AAA family ATPase [Deinococcus sp. QL22]|uniref:AAA family ATPase n=1 Tax=Deinococcus sp. QL22 TaxID=2939437 RepID=UPI0020179B61|nr:AAA family ATPase [Deinococcus sp. QL22]UQN08782.1 AAA family ATPase [Deinococcus sp. QL22]